MKFSELMNQQREISTGNQEAAKQPLLPQPPNTPPYRKGEVDITRLEDQTLYLPYGRRHAEKFGVKIVLNMEQALTLRHGGLAVVTIREADTLARWNVPLDSDFLHKALRAIGGMVVEGIPGEKDNAFFLRERYNKGIEFKRQHYHRVTVERQKAADDALLEIEKKLADMALPLWPEEQNNGILVELCKPEFMNWQQYREAATNYVTRDPDTFGAEHVHFQYGPSAATEACTD